MMENKCKRFLSLLLAFVMVLGMFPAGHAHVHAAEVELTPVTPEAGKTYIICFKADNGDYYAMTSNHTDMNNKGVQLIEKFEGTAEKDLIWTLVPKDNGYLMQADNGQYLSLNGTYDNDAFLRDEDRAEIMTFEESGDGYLIKNPYGRYVCALGGVTGQWAWGAFGNYSTGTTVYFFALPEVSVNLTVGETYKVSGVANALNVTDNEFVDVKSDFVQGTVKNHKLATTIEDGVYVIVNTRSNRWLLNTPVDGAKKLQNVAGEPNLGDNAYLWTVTAVEGEADTYYLGNNGKYLNLPGHEEAELVSDETATVKITASTLESNAWEIFDTNTYMNDLNRGAVGSYAGNDEDPGSQWVFFKVSDVPACTYAGVEAIEDIEDGEQYLLFNTRAKKLMTTESYNGGLKLDGGYASASASKLWTITAAEGENTYYIQDVHGRYFQHANGSAGIYNATKTVQLLKNQLYWPETATDFGPRSWNVKNGSAFLNHHGGGGSIKAAGDNGNVNDTGSQWQIYKVNAIPVGTYDVTVTAKAVGETTIWIGGTVYTFHVATNHVHDYKSTVKVEATCSVEGILVWTCACEDSYEQNIGKAPNVHKNTEIQNAKDATLTEEGYTGDTFCKDCQTTIAEGTVIPVVKPMNAKIGETVYALADCEFTYTADQKLFHAVHGDQGLYLFMNGNSGKTPISTTSSAVVTVNHVYANGAVELASPNNGGINCLHYYSQKVSGKYGWDRCNAHKDEVHANGIHEVYLYTVAAQFDADSAIPGYTKVTALEEGKSYLIVGVDKDGGMFVMHPTTSGNTGDYIAQLVTEDVNHTHNFTGTVVTPATCATDGVERFDCSCARPYTTVIPATGEHSYTNECDTNCKVCGQKTRPGATHVSDAAYDCVAGKCQYCETPMGAAASHTPAADDGDCTSAIKCTVCGTETTAAKGEHTWEAEGVVTTAPTCTDKGVKTFKCTVEGCEETKTEPIAINPDAHKWGDWQTVTPATCSTKGSEERVCAYNAEHVETQDTEIDANAHTYGTLIAAQPLVHTQTELKASVAAHYKCACGKYFTEDYVETSLEALTGETPVHTAGTPVEEDRQEPTLNSTGSYDLVTYCSGCNKEMSRKTETIPALTGAVAEVNGVKYATLAEAIAVGGEVTLLADVELTERLDISGTVSLELNGHTISGDFVDAFGMIYVKKGAELSLVGDGSIIANKTHAIGNYGYVSVEGGNIVTQADETYAGLYNFYYHADYYGSAEISGGSVDSVFNCGILTVKGGKVTYLDNSGLLDVIGGEINEIYARDGSDAPGVIGAGEIFTADPANIANITVPEGFKLVKIGEDHYQVVAKTYVAELNGTKYETLAEALSAAQSGDTVKLLADCEFEGTVVAGATLDLDGHKLIFNGIENLMGAGRISINGGTIVVKQGEDEIEMFGPNALMVKTDDGVLLMTGDGITMIEGTFNLDWPIGTMTVAGTAKLVVESSDTTFIYISLDSTTASVEGPEGMNVTTDVENHEVAYENGIYTLVEKAPVVTNVAMIGEQGYATLADAIAAVNAGETILLVEDVTEEIQISDNAVVNLDLNGKTLNGFFKPFKGKLTVKNGSIENTNSNYSAIEINAGELVLNNVNVTSARHAVRIDGAVTATIDGGEYKLNATKGTRHALNVSGAAVVTIKAGTFVGPKGTTMDSGSAVNAQTGAKVIIKGGSFSGGKLNTLGGAGTITVYGGTFDQNPTARLAEGYCAKAENGVYTVQAHNYKATVTAPTFEADGYTTYTCACGESYVEVDEGSKLVAVAQIDDQKFTSLQAAFDAVLMDDIIELLEDIELDTYLTVDNPGKYCLDLNGHNITRVGGTAIYVNNNDTTLSIEAPFGGKVTGEQAIFAAAGTVEIYRGTFHGTGDAIYAYGTGHIEIYGGTFSAEGPAGTQNAYCVLNVHDGSRATASISVHGTYKPTFIGFNPADNLSEGAGTNFLAIPYYYCSRENNGKWTVFERHVEVVDEAKAPTCTETGLTRGMHCSACGKVLVAQETVPALDHNMQLTDEKVDATCNTAGKEAVYTCSLGCGHTTGGEVIPVTGNHVWGAPNYHNEGSYHSAHYTCTTCSAPTIAGKTENSNHTYTNGQCICGAKEEVETYVAQIGEQGYATLTAAISAAKAGDTITFLADITEDVTVSKSVTIDGAGKTYTGKMTLTNKADITIKNVNFDGKGYNGYAVQGGGAYYVTIEDCTAKGYRKYGFLQVASGTVSVNVKNAAVSDCGYGIKVDYSNAVTLENVDLDCSVAGLLNSNYGEKTITIKNSDISILGTWTRNNTIKTTYTFEGANSIDEFITDAAIDNFKLAAGATLTAPQDITVITDVENHEVVYENGTYKLVEKKVAVAMIGEQGYETLAAAIADAKAGDTITFVADITENVTISKNVTIDGAGKTYTGKMTVKPSLTVTIQNVNFVKGCIEKSKGSKGTLTVKNCNFDGTGTSYTYAVNMNGGNKVVVEGGYVKGFSYGFLYAPSAVTNVSVKDTVVDGMEWGVHVAYGNTVKLDGVKTIDTFYAIAVQNRGNKTITMNNCDISGEYAIYVWERTENSVVDTFVFQGTGNKLSGKVDLSGHAVLKLSGIDATLTAPEGLTVITDAGDGYKVIYEEGVYKVVYAPAAMIGTKGYATLGEAFAAAQNGDTIVVMKNIDLAKETPVLLDGSYNTYFKVEGKNVTVDMNGMTISGAYTDSGKMLVGVFSTDNGGHLTVNGNGTVNVTATAKVYCLFANYEPGCSITIENGAYTLDKASDSLLYSGTNTAENEGITVNGGTFILGNVGTGTNGKPWIINCLGGNDNATVVNGGTFNSDISHQFWANEVSIPEGLALKNNGDGTWTFVEAVACAEEKATSNGATVRKVGYATLQEAIDAAANGKTVTLLKDIELGAADVKAIPGNLTAMINVAGKSLTLDMNGKTITAAYDASELLYTVIYVGDGASLTVKGDGKIDLITGDTKAGKYDCVAYMFLKSGDTGALNIENGTFTANKVEDSMVYTNGDKVVNIKGGNWTLGNVGTKTNGAPWIFNTKGQNERTILVSGGTYNFNVAKQYYACEVSIVDANGNLSYVVDNGNGTWTVTGQTAEVGIVTPTWRTNYLLGYATFKDAVASIAKGAAETTIVLQKDITVKGQFIGHSYAQKVVIDLNGYTMSSTDKTLTVYRAGTEVTVKNGTVHGNTTGGTIQTTYGGKLTLGENVTIKSGGSATALKVDANATLIVDQDTTYVLGGKNDLVVAEGATVQISAGYFKKPVQQAWCAEGYVPTDKLENGYYSVMKDPSIGMEAKIGDTYFESLQAAIEAAQTGDVIVVVNDITVDTTAAVMNSGEYATIYNVAEKAITIDLNGKKIEVTANAADLESYKSGILLGVFCVDNNGELTLTGNGTVTANAVDASLTSDDSHLYSLMVAYGAGSKLTVENGTYHANSVNSALVYSQYDEIVTINGGTYTLGNLGTDSNGSPWLFNAKGQNERNILVNGGTFAADIQHQYYPFEVQMVKELALSKGEDGMYTVVPAVAYVNEQEWSSAWYTNYVGYATVEEAEAAVEGIKTKVVGKNTYYSDREVVTLLVKEEVNLEDVLGGEIANVDLPAGDFTLPTTSGDVSITGTKDTVITVNDVTAKQISMSGVTVKSSGVAYTGIKHSEEVVFNDCTIVGNMYLYAENVVFTNCTFDLSETNDYIWVYGAKNVTFKDCTFNTMGKAILVFQDGSSVDQTVTVEGCTFNATQPGYNWNQTLHIAAVSMDGSRGGTYNVILNNNTVDNNFNGLWQDKTSAGNITVTVDGTTVLTKN